MTSSSFFEELRSQVREHDLLKHSYLHLAEQGILSTEQVKAWALQEYFVSSSFPRMMAAVVTRIPDECEAAKYPLIQNTYEELGGKDGLEQSHPNLLKRLIVGLGGNEQELIDNQPNMGTKAYLERLYTICKEGTFLEGLGAIGHGNEFLVIYEYGKFIKGFDKSHQIEPDYLEFFRVNIEADVRHTEEIERAMEPFLDDATNRKKVEESALQALDARIPFYDDICSQLGI